MNSDGKMRTRMTLQPKAFPQPLKTHFGMKNSKYLNITILRPFSKFL